MEETLDEESASPKQNDLSMNQSKRASPGVGQTHGMKRFTQYIRATLHQRCKFAYFMGRTTLYCYPKETEPPT
jgi:hypothetical protein